MMIDVEMFCEAERTVEERKFADAVYEKLVYENESGAIGYYDLPNAKESEVDAVLEYAKSCSFAKNVVLIGIGGSSLGPKAAEEFLKLGRNRNDKNIFFLENGDPCNLNHQLQDIEAEESVFLIISKSGGTVETLSIAKYVIERFKLKGELFAKHCCAITDKGSPLDAYATEQGAKCFYIPKNVGGRFSVLSAVGLVPLALLGYDVKAMLKGAAEVRATFFSKTYTNIMAKAQYYAKYSYRYRMNVLFSYSSQFREFNAWYVQLWGESLGKINAQNLNIGLTPIGLVGSVDQHSFLQLITEGPRDKSVTFLKIEDFGDDTKIPNLSLPGLEKTDFVNGSFFSELINAQCDATFEILKEQGVPVDIIRVKDISEASFGALVYYFEFLTSATAAFMGVNAYDQPGVEAGKIRLLEKFGKGN